jgi:hypothetical protein
MFSKSEGPMSKQAVQFVSCALIPLFLMFLSPARLEAAGGHIEGFIYASDGTTPMEGAVLKLRNLQSGEEYASGPSDTLGRVSLNDLEPGLYLAGISTEEGDFNFDHMVGIREGVTGKLSFSLGTDSGQIEKSSAQEQGQQKRGGILGFFTSTLGVALLSAATIGTAIAFVVSGEEEAAQPASPLR